MTKKHAKFGSPSGLYAIEACPGKIAFGRDIPDAPESEYAKEGTVFHSFMDEVLTKLLKNEPYAAELKAADKMYPEMSEWIITAGKQFLERYDKFRELHAGVKVKTEVPVKINEDIFGTSDIVMWGTNIKTQKTDVVAIDWKYGKGVAVDATENLQGIAYLVGAVKTLRIENVGKCAVVIAQVRLEDGWSKYVFDGEELWSWEAKIKKIVNQAKELYETGKEIEQHLHAGPHCRFCKAIAVCPAQKKQNYDLVPETMEELPVEDAVKRLTLDEQVKIFLRKSMIEDFLDAVAKNLNAALQSGVTHPAIKMIKTTGRRKWIQDEKKVIAGLKKLKVKKPVEIQTKLIGIGEAEKIVGKGKLDKLTELSSGNFEVVPAADKRQAIKFDEIEELPSE